MTKNKIAFYISLKKIKTKLIDINVENGNPGIGGTQYMFLLTIKYINRLRENKEAILLTDIDIEKIDDEIPMIYVGDEKSAFNYCENNNINILVLNANIIDKIDKKLYNTKINIFCWAHNTLNHIGQHIAARESCIKKIICVSKKQYENMKDSICFEKCTYINNVITEKFYKGAVRTDYSKKSVIYVGSIMPQKGVHNLINIWKYIEKVHPDAELYIFGGASIWNENVEVGNLKIADKYYDKIIKRNLKKVKLKKSIHFMGTQGWETIKKYIKNVQVGVVNPSKYLRDETFCISALEFGTYGIPIVSRMRNDGLVTTVVDGKNGFLRKKDKEIAGKICELMSEKENLIKMGIESRKHARNFIAENEIKKWNILIEEVEKVKNEKRKLKFKISKDTILLFHDFCLKVIFTISSGKFIDLIKKKIHNK